MSKKKTLLTIMAVVLVICIAVMGTLAFLTKQSAAVNNTFIAQGGGDIAKAVELWEHEAVKGEKGDYTLNNELVAENNYSVLPSTDLPKDPFIKVIEKTEVPGYLYVEVVDGLANTGLSYDMADCWAKLDGVTGKNGGAVYVYCDAAKSPVIVTDETTGLDQIFILKNNEIVVADTIGISKDQTVNIDFYGYLAQANAGENAAATFNACFKAST